MVAEKDQPALELVGRGATPGQIAGHRTLVDHQAQLQQFAMNPRRSPTILPGHPSDERLHLPRNTWAAYSLGPGHPPPEHLKPSRCQSTTVSGWTRIKALAQSRQAWRSNTQKARSAGRSAGRERFCLKTASCWRRQGSQLLTPAGPEQYSGKSNRHRQSEPNHPASIAGAVLRDKRLLRPGRVQLGLQPHVQLPDTERATVHWAEHLDVANRVELKLARYPCFEQFQEGCRDLLRLRTLMK